MRALPVVLLLALLLLGGIGWLVLGSDESGEAQIATLEPEVAEPEEVFVPADMSAPREDTREEVKLSEEAHAKAKAKELLDLRSEPEEPGPVGSMRVVVENTKGERVPKLFVIARSTDTSSKFVGPRVTSRRTDAEGVAQFEALPVGEYQFAVRLDNDEVHKAERLRSQAQGGLSVGAGFDSDVRQPAFTKLNFWRALLPLNLDMDEQGAITRIVREQADDELRFIVPSLHALAGVVSERGVPLAQATVRIFLDAESAIDSEAGLIGNVSIPENPFALAADTDVDGKFRIEGLTMGPYAVSVERPSGGMRQNWELEFPDRSASVTFELDSLSVRGVVTTDDGIPVVGAEVVVERARVDDEGVPQPREFARVLGSLYEAGSTEAVDTASDGSFLIEGVDGSSPLVVCARAPWMTTTRSRVFGFDPGEQQREIHLTMTTTGMVTARLITSDPLRNSFMLEVTREDRPDLHFVAGPPDDVGDIVVHGLEPGPYRFQLHVPITSSQLPLVRSETNSGELVLPKPISSELVAGQNLVIELTAR